MCVSSFVQPSAFAFQVRVCESVLVPAFLFCFQCFFLGLFCDLLLCSEGVCVSSLFCNCARFPLARFPRFQWCVQRFCFAIYKEIGVSFSCLAFFRIELFFLSLMTMRSSGVNVLAAVGV